MTELEKVFKKVFVDDNGDINIVISMQKHNIMEAMRLYAQAEVEKLNKHEALSSFCSCKDRYRTFHGMKGVEFCWHCEKPLKGNE